MMLDTNLTFTGGNTGSAQAITSTAVASSGVLDLASGMLTGSTYAAAPMTIGAATVFGEDLGNGILRLPFFATIGTAFSGGTSLNIAIQGAVDAASGSYPANISGLTWTTYAETGAIPVASLGTANSQIDLPDWPHRQIKAALPRFIRLLYTPVGTFSQGTIAFAGMVLQRSDIDVGYYPSGFSVGS